MISRTKTRYEAPVREVFGCLDSAKAATGLWVSWAHRNISLPAWCALWEGANDAMKGTHHSGLEKVILTTEKMPSFLI